MTTTLNKQKKRALELEQGTIASLLMSPSKYPLVSFLTEEDFQEDNHKKIFNKMQEQESFDVLTLGAGEDKKFIDMITSYYDSIPTSDNIVEYATMLRQETKRIKVERMLVNINNEIKKGNFDADLAISELLLELDNVNSLSLSTIKSRLSGLKEIEEFFTMEQEKTLVLKTGMKILDEHVELRNGNMYVIGAGTGIGKSSFAIDLTLKMSKSNKAKGLIYALEMDRIDVNRKMISNISKVKDFKLKKKKINKVERDLIFDALSKLKEEYHITIHDEYGISIDVLVNQVTELKLKGELDFLVVDQISLISTKRNHREERGKLKEISWKIRKLAGDLNIPVIVLVQLNRGSEIEKPSLKHVAESFDIVRDASGVMLLDTNRKEYSEEKQYHLIIEKNRFGKNGEIPMIGKLAISSFEEGVLDGDLDL